MRTRITYWSSSKLSHRIRAKFGLDNPKWHTIEGWNKHEDECRKKAPIIHWVTDRGFDKLQNICYYPFDVFHNIKRATIWKFFRNIWIFRKALWAYRSWDYSGLLNLMETATKDMSNAHENHGHFVRSKDTAKELRVLSHILKRVREDNYTEDKIDFVEKDGTLFGGDFVQKPNTLPSYQAKSFYKLTQKQRTDDLKLACKIIERKLLTFWD